MPTVGVFATIFDTNNHVLCVQRGYPPYGWTTPGGILERNEDPIQAVIREVFEETAYTVTITTLNGVYAAPFRDDLVLGFTGTIVSRADWKPNAEISKVCFFDIKALPYPMKRNTRLRISDAAEGARGIYRTFLTSVEHSGDD